MRRLLAIVAVLVSFAVPAQAAPNPDATIDPYTTFLVARVLPNQNELTLFTASINETNGDAIIRATAQAAARQNRTNNPSWRIVIYGPIDPPLTWYTNGDRIWDSATDL